MSIDRFTGSPDIKIYPLSPDNAANECFRFLNKDNTICERNLFSNAIQEQINLYGTKIQYFSLSFNLTSSDNFYGEETLAPYLSPVEFIAFVNLNENSLMLSKFGFQSDDDVTFYIHISTFYNTFRNSTLSAGFFNYPIEPKAGDIIKLTEYGSDRPGERDGKMFEITQRLDQNIDSINPLLGHYTWMLKAKRWEPSNEVNITPERGNNQVYDDIKLPGTEGPDKGYNSSANNESSRIFGGSNDTDVYGDYGT